jgi:hypothetical protein
LEPELELEPDPTHFYSAPAWKNDLAPAPTPILRPVLCKIYCIQYSADILNFFASV